MIEQMTYDENDIDDADVDPPPIPMGRGHRARRKKVIMPHKEFLFLQTLFEKVNNDLHFQFMQQVIKDVKEK